MKSYWIWSYGDYEIFHTNRVNARRQQYGMDYPPFWKIYDVDRNVIFRTEKEIDRDGTVTLHVNGFGYLKIDREMYGNDTPVRVTKGAHTFEICVMNLTGLPAAYLEGDVLQTDNTWYTLNEKQEKQPVGYSESYVGPTDDPETFPFSYKKMLPVSAEAVSGGTLYTFERELFGFLYIKGVHAEDKLHVSYGESKEEALDTAFSVVQEDVAGRTEYKLRQRAFRYIFITGGAPKAVEAELEYCPLQNKATFRCDNEDVNKIWDMSAYTLQLNMREVLTEAIKRDRWLWGGDAYQAFKFIKYLCEDGDLVRRSLIGLRGKEPFTQHINTITDYSLLWVIGLPEYFENYGDLDFIRAIYPRAESLMAFCAGREDENGFIVSKYGDWIFVDWSDMDKTGAVCAEQMLYIAANRAMAKLAEALGESGAAYKAKAEDLAEKVDRFYWNEEKGAYIDSFSSGKNHVTRHANIFAVLYDIADEAQREKIVQNVLKNDAITKITTPYFEGYELDVMGKLGDTDYIYDMLTSYWKGMLDLGATTVWEEYDPKLSGAAHYAMYGDRYQKSLCHAWGASPIYLIGRYFLGITGTSPNWETFTVCPQRGKFNFIEGTVPVRGGKVHVYLSNDTLRVKSEVAGGTLLWGGKAYPLPVNETVTLSV